MIKTKNIELSSTPINLTYTGAIDPPIALSIQNVMTSGFAYLGAEDVSSTNYGYKLYPSQSFIIELAPNDKIFAVGDSGVRIAIFSLDIQ